MIDPSLEVLIHVEANFQKGMCLKFRTVPYDLEGGNTWNESWR